MTLALSPAEVTLIVVGGFTLLLAIVIVRLVARDRGVRRIRFGVFYERERDDDYEEDEPVTHHYSGGTNE